MKINEITDKFKVMQSGPQGIKLASQNGTEITLPPGQASALTPDPQNPKSSVLNLNNMATGQMPTTQPDAQPQTAAPGQAPVGQAPTAPGQAPTAPGQAPTALGQQPQLPKVGSEVELPDNIGSTMSSNMQTEKFDDSDLVKNGNKTIGGPKGGDKTDDLINDVEDHKWERTAGRSGRNVVQPNPVRESAELIAMLTIAGLR
jgi:hypothetical protein